VYLNYRLGDEVCSILRLSGPLKQQYAQVCLVSLLLFACHSMRMKNTSCLWYIALMLHNIRPSEISVICDHIVQQKVENTITITNL